MAHFKIHNLGVNTIMIRVGILGASGYMGGEALRVLLEHSAVKVELVTSRSGKKVEHYHRNFYGSGTDFIRLENITPCDPVFVALPTGKAMEITPGLLKNGTKVIDLGADFRLNNLDEWREVYGKDHSCKEIAEEAVYGIAELHREAIRKARVIGNPPSVLFVCSNIGLSASGQGTAARFKYHCCQRNVGNGRCRRRTGDPLPPS